MTTSKPDDWLGSKITSVGNPMGITTSRLATYNDIYDNSITSVDAYNDRAGIDDLTGREVLEVIQKGIYKTLVTRRDDAKAIWEEEDDDASYGEYKALKETVELLDAFIRKAPKATYSGVSRRSDYDRYNQYGRRY